MRPLRKWSTVGDGMVIFGVTLVLALRNLKCSSIGWSAGKSILADHAQRLGLGLDALELDALVGLVDLDARQVLEEIEVPPGAAELAVGGELEADLLLLPDDLPDLLVLDGLELRRP